MSDAGEITDTDLEVSYEIPNAWRAMRIIGDAMQLLASNPDLIGEDVKLALESETPEVISLLDACIYNHLDLKDMAEAKKTRLHIMTQRVKDAEARRDKARELVGKLMQALKLKKHDAPGGRANLIERARKLHIIDESQVPDIYKHEHTVVTTVIDTKAIAQYLKDNPGKKIPGVERANSYSSATITGR